MGNWIFRIGMVTLLVCVAASVFYYLVYQGGTTDSQERIIALQKCETKFIAMEKRAIAWQDAAIRKGKCPQ